MIDQAREWLERLHASNAPEADMALDLLGRLDSGEGSLADDEANSLQEEHDALDEKLERCANAIDLTDNLWVPGPLNRDDPAEAIRALARCCNNLCEALGADGPEEAIAMARTLREAFE